MAPPVSGSKGNEGEIAATRQFLTAVGQWQALPLEEIGNLVAVGSKPAETLMNVVVLMRSGYLPRLRRNLLRSSAKRARWTASLLRVRSGCGRWRETCGGVGITIPPVCFTISTRCDGSGS